MKNLKLLIEDVYLFLEANIKPLYTIWQNKYIKEHTNKKEYKDLTDTEKNQLSSFITIQNNLLEHMFNQIPNIDEQTKQWIIKVFSNQEQDFYTDREKIIDQLKRYLSLKNSEKLEKNERDLYKFTYQEFYKIYKKYEKEIETKESYGNNEIIRKNGDWTIVKFTIFKDSEPYLKKANWCVKYEDNFIYYRSPFYGFYHKNKPFALLHISTSQLRDVEDEIFNPKTITKDFEDQLVWFLDMELKNDHLSCAGEFIGFLIKSHDKFEKYFGRDDLIYAYNNLYLEDEITLAQYKKMLDTLTINYKGIIGLHYLQDLLDTDFKKYSAFLDDHDGIEYALKYKNKNGYELFKTIVNKDDYKINDYYEFGQHLLYYIILNKNVEMLKILLTSKHSKKLHLNFKIMDDNTVLNQIVLTGDLYLIKTVLEYGIPIGLDVMGNYIRYKENRPMYNLITMENNIADYKEVLLTFLKLSKIDINYTQIFDEFPTIVIYPISIEILFEYKKPDIDKIKIMGKDCFTHLNTVIEGFNKMKSYVELRRAEKTLKLFEKYK